MIFLDNVSGPVGYALSHLEFCTSTCHFAASSWHSCNAPSLIAESHLRTYFPIVFLPRVRSWSRLAHSDKACTQVGISRETEPFSNWTVANSFFVCSRTVLWPNLLQLRSRFLLFAGFRCRLNTSDFARYRHDSRNIFWQEFLHPTSAIPALPLQAFVLDLTRNFTVIRSQ